MLLQYHLRNLNSTFKYWVFLLVAVSSVMLFSTFFLDPATTVKCFSAIFILLSLLFIQTYRLYKKFEKWVSENKKIR
jgi:hypothetical protein